MIFTYTLLMSLFNSINVCQFLLKILVCCRDWRFLLIFILCSSFFWVFYQSANWFTYQLIIFLLCCLCGIIFCPQRLFFIGLLIACLGLNYAFLFPKITLTKLQQCKQTPEFLEANINKKTQKYLLLSQIKIFCKEQKYTIASAILTTKKKYIPVYAGEKIRIIYPKITYKENNWLLESTPQTKFFSTKHKILREKRSSLWQDWKNKSNYYLAGKAKEIYQGIALSDRSSLSRDLRHKIAALGIFHLFAISGLHIGMIFLWVHFLLSKLLNILLLLIKKQKSSLLASDLLSVLVVWFYLDFIVFPITAVRAWVMLAIWIAIRHLFNWIPAIYVLCITALLMILLQPAIVFSLSFQFSFLAVFAILVFGKWTNFSPASLLLLYKKFFQTAMLTLFINFFTAPLTLIYFHKLNLLSFLNNPFHIFFMGFIYLPTVLAGFFFIPLGLAQYYFLLVQKISDIWYWTMEKNFDLSNFAVISWQKNSVFNDWLLFYILFLCIVSIATFQYKKNG